MIPKSAPFQYIRGPDTFVIFGGVQVHFNSVYDDEEFNFIVPPGLASLPLCNLVIHLQLL